ncbi:hypothetical protein Ndes2526B_g08977 [Nannochloris sp. 'desiccata']
MGSITQSPDRVAQVLSGSAVQQGAGDSALQPADSNPVQVVEQAFTGVSAAEIVYESRQQHSSVSEGVASAGNPPQLSIDRMDEFMPAGAFEPPVSAAVGCEGETSGGDYAADPAGGSNGYGELAETGDAAPAAVGSGGTLTQPAPVPPPSPMDFQTTASGHAGPSPIGKRKSSFEVSDFLDPKRPEGLNRVPSDLAMVTGLSDGEAGEPEEAPQRRPMDATDSNIGGILAGVAAAPTFNEGDTAEAMFAPMNEPSTAAGAATTSMPPPPPVVPQVATIAGDGATTQGVGNVRPTDADIIAWENRIKEEEVRNIPLIGDIEPLQALEAEYRSGNDIFLAKIAALRRGYSAIRRTRGDGNCFFRSFVFAYLEQILRTGDLAERNRAVGRLNGIKQVLLNAGYEELVLESPLELLLAMLRSIGSPTDPLTLEALEGNMKSEDVSNYVVFLLRMATSAEVKRRADFFAPFIMGLSDMDVETFCRSCIDPMGEESDHVQMVALTDALQVPVRVIYLDRSLALGGGSVEIIVGGGDIGACDAISMEFPAASGAVGDGPGVSFASAAPGGAASTAGTVVSGIAGGGAPVKVDVHDFVPDALVGSAATEPRVHLLYRPGHYDVLYPA